jgi:hypothetical protein
MKSNKIREGPAERHQRREREQRMRALATAAVERRATAESYERRPVRLIDKNGGPDWQPDPHQCHANVMIWVRHSPAHKRVKGFVLFGPSFQVWRVLAHSLVEMEDGTLVDITPHGVSQPYPFVRHIGSDDAFEEFANHGEINICLEYKNL